MRNNSRSPDSFRRFLVRVRINSDLFGNYVRTNKTKSFNKKNCRIVENDKDLDTTVWLKYDVIKDDREHMSNLKCAVCIQFSKWLVSLRNYNPAFINGSKNTRTSDFKDHADTEMHKHAMSLYQKQHSKNICDYVPIAKVLLQPSMDEATKRKLKNKFELAYMVAKENLSLKR